MFFNIWKFLVCIVVIHLRVKNVLVHHVLTHTSIGIQRQSYLFAVSSATRQFRNSSRLKQLADAAKSPTLVSINAVNSALYFLFFKTLEIVLRDYVSAQFRRISELWIDSSSNTELSQWDTDIFFCLKFTSILLKFFKLHIHQINFYM